MEKYPQRLYHKTPSWVADTAIFHIRIRCDRENKRPLTHPLSSGEIIASVVDYADRQKWSCYCFLLMPDHLHALLSFGRINGISEVIRNWKRARTKFQGVKWQDGFFDHRIRTAGEFTEKYEYIRQNPVVLGLCEKPDDWPHMVTNQFSGVVSRF